MLPLFGSGNLIRTDDIPGMNRLLYQLSYAAMCGQMVPAPPKPACVLYKHFFLLSRGNSRFFAGSFGYTFCGVIFVKIPQKSLCFLLGGTGYVVLELLWRGRSHVSMFFAGGLCFLLIGRLEETEPRLSAPLRALAGAAIITMVELGAGLLVNRDYAVWDYRGCPGNFCGQICPLYSFLWLPTAWAAERLYRLVTRAVRNLHFRTGTD